MARITELEQTVGEKDELMARIVELEQSAKSSQTENVKLKAEIKELKQAVKNIMNHKRTATNDLKSPACSTPLSNNRENVQVVDSLNHHEADQSMTSTDLVTLDTSEQDQDLSLVNQDASTGSEKTVNLLCDAKTVTKCHDLNNSDTTSEILESDNQIVEGLIQEMIYDQAENIVSSEINPLYSNNDEVNATEINKLCIQDMAPDSVQSLSDLFDKAIKSGQKQILNWYYYSLEFENKVKSLIADGKIKDKTARSKIYKEMKAFLPNITDLRYFELTCILMNDNMSSNTILHDYSSSHPIIASGKMLTDDYYKWYAELDDLSTPLTDKIRLILYRAYTEETGLDPWINSETSESKQIKEDADDYMSHECVIKISKFPEDKDIIHDAVHKRFPFLTYTNSNAWHRDVFKYTNLKAKCPICKDVHTRLGIWGDWSYLAYWKLRYQTKSVTHQFIQTKPTYINMPSNMEWIPVITEAEKKRWTMGCFRGDLERDMRCYQDGIKRKEDPRKYHKFLTDRDRLIGEELLRRGILKSGLSTTWLDDLMEEWEKTYNQFVQIFN
ncbi:5272_t:CDS:2 [Diversispora eburnea]|uniref:5272_t:CDS:1 n=1 Tax=Diversispora eburnea TaxID=1213867 RepID=A0A9N9CB25_9GLOM|nr:5272_t:CDS:2 [Diversispora eburnea]